MALPHSSLASSLPGAPFGQRVASVDDDTQDASNVVARRRIGERSKVPQSPFVERVPGVDVDRAIVSGNVVSLPVPSRTLPGVAQDELEAVVAPASTSSPSAPPRGESPGWLSSAVYRAIRALPPPLSRHALWARNLFLGATLSFADASLATLKPVAFLWKNLHVVSLGLTYLTLPLVPSLALLYHVEPLGRAYAPNTLVGGLYLTGLYVSSAVLLMAAALAAGFAWRGCVRVLNHFARTGEQAFPVR